MRDRGSNPTRTLIALCLASICWGFSFGVGSPLASVWLQDADHSDTIVGLNTTTYYLGIALAAGLVPRLMRWSSRGCLLLGMLLSGLTVAAFPWGESLTGWFVLRLLNGAAGALSIIPTETLVNHTAPSERRSRNFGFYALAMGLGIGLGMLIGPPLYSVAPRLAFVLGGVLALAGGGIIYGWLPATPPPVEEKGSGPLPLGATWLSFGSAWSQGFLEGGMVGFLLVYLLGIGYNDLEAGWLTSSTLLGVLLFQVPVAWLADRLGRTRVLFGCYLVAAAGLAGLAWSTATVWLAVWLFLVGACSSAFYPLGLAVLGERLPNSALARANAWYLAINCVGSLTGPAVIGVVMDLFGRRALFVAGETAVLLVLVSWLVLRIRQRWQGRVLGPLAPHTESAAA